MRAHRVTVKRLAILPLVFGVLGVAGSATRAMPTDAEAVAYLAASAALGVGFGVWRGLVIPVWRDGADWYEQGNAKTLTLWATMLALKGALALAASAADVYPGDHSGEIYIFVALSFAAQEGLVARRTIWSGSGRPG